MFATSEIGHRKMTPVWIMQAQREKRLSLMGGVCCLPGWIQFSFFPSIMHTPLPVLQDIFLCLTLVTVTSSHWLSISRVSLFPSSYYSCSWRGNGKVKWRGWYRRHLWWFSFMVSSRQMHFYFVKLVFFLLFNSWLTSIIAPFERKLKSPKTSKSTCTTSITQRY